MRGRAARSAALVLGAAGGLAAMGIGQPALGEGAGEERHFRLTARALACLIEHREVYRASAGDPVFVVIDDCPPERAASLLDVLVNEGPNVTLRDPDGLDRFLTLSRTDLGCLDSLSVAPGEEIVHFFPGACRVDKAPAPP